MGLNTAVLNSTYIESGSVTAVAGSGGNGVIGGAAGIGGAGALGAAGGTGGASGAGAIGYAGGVVAFNSAGNINDSYAEVSVSATGGSSVLLVMVAPVALAQPEVSEVPVWLVPLGMLVVWLVQALALFTNHIQLVM